MRGQSGSIGRSAVEPWSGAWESPIGRIDKAEWPNGPTATRRNRLAVIHAQVREPEVLALLASQARMGPNRLASPRIPSQVRPYPLAGALDHPVKAAELMLALARMPPIFPYGVFILRLVGFPNNHDLVHRAVSRLPAVAPTQSRTPIKLSRFRSRNLSHSPCG